MRFVFTPIPETRRLTGGDYERSECQGGLKKYPAADFKDRTAGFFLLKRWYARCDSNARPSTPEADALSN